MSLAVVKIPLVLLLTVGYEKSILPPHAPPPKDELVTSTKMEKTKAIPMLIWLLYIQRYACFAEVITVLANLYPQFHVLQAISQFSTLKNLHGTTPPKPARDSANTLGFTVMLCGILLRLSGHKFLGTFFRHEVSIQKNHRLITSGPYAYVRHPAYTGGALITLGWTMWNLSEGSWVRESGILGTWVGFLAFWGSVFVMVGAVVTGIGRVAKEDEALRQRFGKEWDEWRSRVKWAMIPGVF